MALQWTTTGKHALEHGIKVCVYGRSGTGKTRLVATAPRPVIASAESGTLSIAAQNIPLVKIGKLSDLQEFYTWLVTSADARNFDTVCLDSISEIAEVLLSAEKAKTKDPRQAYGEMQDQIAVQIRLFRDLPFKNVYFTAKAEMKVTPLGAQMWSPMMPGNKTGPQIPYYFDEFFRLDTATTPDGVPYNFLQTRSDPMFEAKDRSGALDAIERPDLTFIFNKIKAAYTR